MQLKKYLWKTARIVEETADTITIVFDAKEPFGYKPGQFVNLTLEIDGERVTRSYSLSSYCEEDDSPAITIKLLRGGLMSSYILHNAHNIAEWEIEGPFGNFTPPEKDYSDTPVVLLAGGSGITPLMPIMRNVLAHGAKKLLLVFANKSMETIIFKEALTGFSDKRKFRLIHALSRQEIVSEDVLTGRLDAVVIKKTIKDYLDDQLNDALFFICGPEALMDLYKKAVSELGVEDAHILTEHFVIEENDNIPVSLKGLPDKTYEILLHYNEITNLVEVPPGMDIMTAAHADKIPIPFSCKNGTCGTCYGRVLKGEVKLLRNLALSDDHLKDGYTLLCQAHPLTEDVEIDVQR
ncbi:MAG: iron-sulfur cluster-binding domain-containing protein [Sphingobacteriales bacterium]|nr:MAG: iron-sulfur cluster-binding domain-containing protein [Sphingobacteriales bacterium]